MILFGPWTKDEGNPSCPVGIDDIRKANLVLVSHDHFDHVGSAVPICKKTWALLEGPVQTVKRMIDAGPSESQMVNFGYGYMVGGGVVA